MAEDKRKPEEIAREEIDAQLAQAGWKVQSREDMNLDAGNGVAVREFRTPHGQRTYCSTALVPPSRAAELAALQAKGMAERTPRSSAERPVAALAPERGTAESRSLLGQAPATRPTCGSTGAKHIPAHGWPWRTAEQDRAPCQTGGRTRPEALRGRVHDRARDREEVCLSRFRSLRGLGALALSRVADPLPDPLTDERLVPV